MDATARVQDALRWFVEFRLREYAGDERGSSCLEQAVLDRRTQRRHDESRAGAAQHRGEPGGVRPVLQSCVCGDAVFWLPAARSGCGRISELGQHAECRFKQFPAHDLRISFLDRVSTKIRTII